MGHAMRFLAAVVAGVLLALAPASPVTAGKPVDLQLILAVDVSQSMDRRERNLQREGYAAALTSPEVMEAIKTGPHGRIAIAYFEWASLSFQNVIIPWTVIESPEDALLVAALLRTSPSMSSKSTSITGAIDFGVRLFARSGYDSFRRVIDISGDGPNNQGPPVNLARDKAVAAGIVINALPLMTNRPRDNQRFEELDRYYADCVIGGPGAFVIPVTSWEQFPESIRRKLVLEIASIGTLLRATAAADPKVWSVGARSSFECMFGGRRPTRALLGR